MIDFANLKETHREQQAEIEEAMISIARNAQYIMGQEVSGLETELAAFVGEGRAIACSSGSSALLLAILALGLAPGDEVITTPFSFIASSSMPALLGIKPVFVDILPDDFNIDPAQIESAITPKTKAILAVSLYGQPPNLEQLEQIAQRQDLRLIIDGAQSFGATCNKRKDSVFGDIATTSFFPSKPLGCYGDGGAVFTRNEELAERLFSLHLHGQSERYVHPLLDDWIRCRQQFCELNCGYLKTRSHGATKLHSGIASFWKVVVLLCRVCVRGAHRHGRNTPCVCPIAMRSQSACMVRKFLRLCIILWACICRNASNRLGMRWVISPRPRRRVRKC